jgi:Cof subfamily protein (haloacid dehalogenase superfamily)
MLDSSGRIPEGNAMAVREALKRGIAVTISTGRMYKSAEKFARELGLGNTPIICYNGAMLRDRDNTKFHIKLDMDVALEMLAILRERGLYIQSYTDDELCVRSGDDEDYIYYRTHFGIEGRVVGDEIFNPSTAPTKLLAKTNGHAESRAMIAEFSEKFRGRAYITSSNEDFVEMMNPAAGKGKCVRQLATLMGIPMENVMTLGDGDNDVEMLEMAGVGIAMSNARDDAKAAARDVAPSNDDCGVAWAIEKYALSRG